MQVIRRGLMVFALVLLLPAFVSLAQNPEMQKQLEYLSKIEGPSGYRNQAEHGIPRGQMNFARMYENGFGVEQNYVIAYMWTTLATAGLSGDELREALVYRDDLAAKMTSLQIADAQQRAREWHPVDVVATSRALAALVGSPAGRPLKASLPKPDVDPVCPKVEPAYTEDGRRKRLQGSVTLDAIVNVDGTVTVTEVVRRMGEGLDEEAIKAVQNLKCVAGKKDGKSVAATARLVIDFHLN